MLQGALVAAALVLFSGCGGLIHGEDVHEEFETTVQLDPDGRLSIENTNGSIRIETWDRDEVRIEARKSASSERALDRIEIEIEVEVEGEGRRVEVRTHFRKIGWWGNGGQVAYKLRVPVTADVEAETVNGTIRIDSLAGRVVAKTVKGAVRVEDCEGAVEAGTVNGHVEIHYTEVPDQQEHAFATVNGGVDVYLPGDVEGRFSARTINGSIKTDFPLTVHGMKVVGPKWLDGTLGEGGGEFSFNTVNGSIRIHRAETEI